MTLCAKSLLNGPCGGAENGKCEVDSDRDCGWILIYERLKKLGRLDLIKPYQKPKNHAKWSRPRSLKVSPHEATFCSQDGEVTVSNQDWSQFAGYPKHLRRIIMKLSELFNKGEFVVTGEVGPVKGAIPRDESYIPPCARKPNI